MKTFVNRVNLYRTGDDPIHGESVISVSIDEEGAGPFLCIHQSLAELRLDFNEVEPLYELMKKMMNDYAATFKLG